MTTSPSKQHGSTNESAEIVASQNDTQRPIWEVVAEIGAQIPDEQWAKIPNDGSINYKHYLYGTFKDA